MDASTRGIATVPDIDSEIVENEQHSGTDMNLSYFSHISDEQIISFNSNDSVSFETEESDSRVNTEVAKQIGKCLENTLDFNSPLTCLRKNIEIINDTPGIKVELPATMFKIRKTIKPAFRHEFHYACHLCENYTLDDRKCKSDQIACDYCDGTIKKSSHNFFVYIPLKQQLMASIEKNWESILDFKCRKRDTKFISDIHDGVICQNIDTNFPNTFNLSLLLNSDGAQVFKSSTKTLWPVQLYQNFLHPRVRYIATNVIVVGLYFGKKKPKLGKLLYPLIQELNSIRQEGGFCVKNLKSASEISFMPFLAHAVFDLPARAMCQGIVQYNGKCACGYCKHPGVSIKNVNNDKKYCRYVDRKVEETPRTHQDTVQSISNLKNAGKKGIDGFRRVSCLIGLPYFDLINGFCLDYLHCILLGVMPQLVELWLNSKNSLQPYYIQNKKILNRRILSIKPTSAINRKPRSIFEKENYKGNEWRSHLLYYLRYCLPGLLESRYVKHFELLSVATYKLCRRNIPIGDIDEAETMLNEFVSDFEILYGTNRVTMNIHLLRHLANTVRHCGPLWAQAMFAFEQSNGDLVRTITARNKVLNQITERYIYRHTIDTKKHSHSQIKFKFRKTHKVFDPSLREMELFRQHNISIEASTIWQSIEFKGELYTSTVYGNGKNKSIDYCVQFHDNQIGNIMYYIYYDGIVYALAKMFDVNHINHHFHEVILTQSILLHPAENMREKLIYMKLGLRQVVCRIPNNCEKT